jgi:hypothetical protein
MTNQAPTALDPKWREKATLTIEQAALVLGISRWSAYEQARRNDGIPVIRLGRRLIVSTARLRAMLGEIEPMNKNSAPVDRRDAAQKSVGGDDRHDPAYSQQ